MKILGIDTSTSVATVALATEDQIIAEMSLNDKRTHSQKLMGIIDALLKHNHISIKDLDAIAVGVGPGSFTGLRIGVTTAKGLAHGGNIPVIEVSSLKALTENVMMDCGICAMMDARRDTVFVDYKNMHFEADQLHIDEVIDQCGEEEKVVFVGDGAYKHKAHIEERLGNRAYFAPVHLSQVRGGSICTLAFQQMVHKKYDDVQVSYLRKSQAEREYDDKQS
ncbi:MAG: tRNA (adenosine(37)-N6)-threonylcarbamoyltransferase complex dimerization subunit type 1 TsaB [Clostridia bacterium]|nr:tRNA (adenosine(37)-N6)-threonylcarbamoyltransferase complex dimerization subunit type 1 TsaB [Clostridia bacterium]